MTEDEFWALIEQARQDANGHVNREALTQRLTTLSLEQILAFSQLMDQKADAAYQWQVCAAAYLVRDYISDDTFSDFQRGVVGLGRTAFERAIEDADTLADDPLIQAIAAGQVDRHAAFDSEGVHFAASTAYERKCDDEAYWDALQDLPDEEPGPSAWSGDFGSKADAELIPRRLPRLSALFAKPTGASGGQGT